MGTWKRYCLPVAHFAIDQKSNPLCLNQGGENILRLQFDLSVAFTCGLAKDSEMLLNQKGKENLQLPCLCL